MFSLVITFTKYFGSNLKLWNKIQKLFTKKIISCNLKIIFLSAIAVKGFYTFKEKLPKMLHSGPIYKYKCGYYGKTKSHFKVWICEHFGISHLSGKKVKINEK